MIEEEKEREASRIAKCRIMLQALKENGWLQLRLEDTFEEGALLKSEVGFPILLHS